jgi:hypothetical protein
VNSIDQATERGLQLQKRSSGARRIALWTGAFLAVGLIAAGIIPRVAPRPRGGDGAGC